MKFIMPLLCRSAEGLRLLLKRLSTSYPSIPLTVSGLGLGNASDDVRDKHRVEWLRFHVDEVLKGEING